MCDRPKQYPPVVFLTESDRKRILVTGGAGFVGSHLVDTLMRDGHEVTSSCKSLYCIVLAAIFKSHHQFYCTW